MKYVFLTNSIGGYSGGPTYVLKKMRFLESRGWSVMIFDSTGFGNSEICQEELKRYKDNRYQELFFSPYWLRTSQREKMLTVLIDKIGNDGEIVVESNTVAMSLWGELVASRIHAKHIVYLLSEKLSVTRRSLYDFYKFKSERKELFTISTVAYKKLMARYEQNDDAKASDHYWSADISVPVEDVECKELSVVSRAKYNIGHFGRTKGYFEYMFNSVARFANKYSDSINFILLGECNVPEKWKNELPDNVCLMTISARQPIPKRFFDMCDVVIATAGCANISYRYGAKVISMDVYGNTPLGVVGYDTEDRNIRSEGNKYNLSLEETLENVIVKKKYETPPVLEMLRSGKGHEYQLNYVVQPDGKYYDVSHVSMPFRKSYSFINKLLLSLGMVSLCSQIRYRMIRRHATKSPK